jgi:hypothetical protein
MRHYIFSPEIAPRFARHFGAPIDLGKGGNGSSSHVGRSCVGAVGVWKTLSCRRRPLSRRGPSARSPCDFERIVFCFVCGLG